mmetsp:Transcript_33849/g.41722  ORF Transcript_33849/g.41722 Transcript_33849/m.41722 type:complete len:303 (-) Transcript_33849:326-1234(-)
MATMQTSCKINPFYVLVWFSLVLALASQSDLLLPKAEVLLYHGEPENQVVLVAHKEQKNQNVLLNHRQQRNQNISHQNEDRQQRSQNISHQDEDRKYIFFKHIRKAAGSTVRNYFARIMGKREVKKVTLKDMPREVRLNDKFWTYYEQEWGALDKKCFERDPSTWDNMLTIVTFRDPIERLWSEYWYSARKNAHEWNQEEKQIFVNWLDNHGPTSFNGNVIRSRYYRNFNAMILLGECNCRNPNRWSNLNPLSGVEYILLMTQGEHGWVDVTCQIGQSAILTYPQLLRASRSFKLQQRFMTS